MTGNKKRYKNALAIQEGGASNAGALIYVLGEAAEEAARDNMIPARCPAIQLIIHQLYCLTIGECAPSQWANYESAMDFCRKMIAEKEPE